MLNQGTRSLAWLLSLSLIAVACGDDDDDTGGTGGTSGKGGTASTGGKAGTGGTATSGGTSGKGGTPGTGGTVTTGGKAGTGGSIATGGTTSTGGVVAGGASGEGGMPEGGAMTGGSGGSTEGGTAGAPTGGTAGESTGGVGGVGGADPVGGAGGEGGEAAVEITLVNPAFDTTVWADPPTGWIETGPDGAAASTSESPTPHSGLRYYNLYSAAAYEVTWSQIVLSIPNGNYSLALWHEGALYTEQYAFARGYSSDTTAKVTTAIAASTAWEQIVVSPIPVTNGQIEIGVYSKAAAGNWSHFDSVTLTKLP